MGKDPGKVQPHCDVLSVNGGVPGGWFITRESLTNGPTVPMWPSCPRIAGAPTIKRARIEYSEHASKVHLRFRTNGPMNRRFHGRPSSTYGIDCWRSLDSRRIATTWKPRIGPEFVIAPDRERTNVARLVPPEGYCTLTTSPTAGSGMNSQMTSRFYARSATTRFTAMDSEGRRSGRSDTLPPRMHPTTWVGHSNQAGAHR